MQHKYIRENSTLTISASFKNQKLMKRISFTTSLASVFEKKRTTRQQKNVSEH